MTRVAVQSRGLRDHTEDDDRQPLSALFPLVMKSR